MGRRKQELKPYRLKYGRWAVKVPGVDEVLAEELRAIPGVSVNEEHEYMEVTGFRDAMSVVLQHLGEPPLKPFQGYVEESIELPDFLRPYQRDGVRRMVHLLDTTSGALLADDMGLGKSVQAVVTARHFEGRKLIVCPASVRETWRGELKKLGETSVAVMTPGRTKADALEWASAAEAQWVVSSYELLPRVMAECFGAAVPEVVIADEAHLIRGRNSNRAKAVQTAIAMGGKGMLLTGTPLWSRPRDLWKLLRALWGNRFGSQYAFDERYCDGKSGQFGGWENKGATNTDELYHRLSHYMVRREKRDVAQDLPPLTRQVIWLDSTPQARVAYERLKLNLSPYAMHLALMATLSGKFKEAVRLATDARRFVLFTWMKAHAEQMHRLLHEEGVPCELVTGDVSTKERQVRIERAIENKAGVVATIDAVGTGVDALKHVGSIGIVHALDWVPLKMAQAEARLHRLGMGDDPVTLYYLAMKDSADVPVIETVVSKLDAFAATVGAKEVKKMRTALGTGPDLRESEDELLQSLYASMLGKDAPNGDEEEE